MTNLAVEPHLRAGRLAGRKLLVPYVTAGITDDWTAYLRAYAAAGADAIEIGLPFSDPTLDGPVIQAASTRAIDRGATVRSVLADLTDLTELAGLDVPLIAMTYYNLVLHEQPERFCAALAAAGVRGLVVPDVPLEEVDELERVAADAGVELVLLASPATPAPRIAEIAARSRGFVYAVSVMGPTGERHEVAAAAAQLGQAITAVTDRPVLLGFGISTPEQAVVAARHGDGVVIASALMRQALAGARPTEVAATVAATRLALDQAYAA